MYNIYNTGDRLQHGGGWFVIAYAYQMSQEEQSKSMAASSSPYSSDSHTKQSHLSSPPLAHNGKEKNLKAYQTNKRSNISLSIQKQLLLDIAAHGGLGTDGSWLKELCDKKPDTFGISGSELQDSICNKMYW
jgi:hypothetical protein